MNDQALSIEQMQELIELGIDTSTASFKWVMGPKNTVIIGINVKTNNLQNRDNVQFKITPTFALQDILEMLPSYKITYDKYTRGIDRYEIRIDIPEGQHYITHIAQSPKSLLEAAFNMLKWCKENNYI